MKLEVRGLEKSFGDRRVLHNVAVTSGDVKCVALIGPSGGGKSTLLRVLAGLEYPDAGEVTWDGAPMDFREEWLLPYRRRVGTVFQAFNLFPHLSALRNIAFPLEAVHGQSRAQAEAKATALLERFGLGGHASHRPAELSGGQRQRVAIARAVAIEPRVLFFDEPTSALDPEMTAEVLEIIEELKADGRHLILVTHQINFARRLGDLILYLQDGTILESGPPEEVFGAPRTVECQKFLAKVLKY